MNLEFGKNLKMFRYQKNMTQDDLAQALSLSVQAISRYETGAAYPDIEMLPVIAGFFGVTVDKLLGVSSEAGERRMREYALELRKITDHKERLELLRKQHAEFPDEWDVVVDMAYEMTFIPECVNEIREIADNAINNCNNNLLRENIFFSYIRCEPDEDRANAFIEKYASRYDMRKVQLLADRYSARGEHEKLKSIRQKILLEELEHSLYGLTVRIGDNIPASYENCRHALAFIDHFSSNSNHTKPDMWVSIRLQIMLRLANNCFMISKNKEGFAVLDEAVTLFENSFALENGTVLTYASPLFDKLSATTEKRIYYHATEFTGIFAKSTMMDLIYETPIGPIDKDDKYAYDLEGFTKTMLFSDHTYSFILKGANWDGFKKVKDDPRYIDLQQRAKMVGSLENIDNLMLLMDSEITRTDDYINDKKWVCALLVKDFGAYMIYDDTEDIKLKFSRMQKEGNKLVYQVACVEFGGGFIELPEIIKKRLLELNEDNKNAQVVIRDDSGEIIYTTI